MRSGYFRLFPYSVLALALYQGGYKISLGEVRNAPVTIRVLMLNAKTGGPESNAGVNFFVKGVRNTASFGTNAEGVATIEVKPDDQVSPLTNWGHTCRKHPEFSEPEYTSVQEILTHGVVIENTCGKARAEPVRGQITIFVRKLTFWEAFKT